MTSKLLLSCLLLMPMISACSSAATTAPQKTAPVAPTESVMCTQDAMQCPDGRWVGRSGPACEFKCAPAR